jgi:hypothetical protein
MHTELENITVPSDPSIEDSAGLSVLDSARPFQFRSPELSTDPGRRARPEPSGLTPSVLFLKTPSHVPQRGQILIQESALTPPGSPSRDHSDAGLDGFRVSRLRKEVRFLEDVIRARREQALGKQAETFAEEMLKGKLRIMEDAA